MHTYHQSCAIALGCYGYVPGYDFLRDPTRVPVPSIEEATIPIDRI